MSRLSWQSPKDFFEDLWGTWEDLSRPEKHKPEVAVISFFCRWRCFASWKIFSLFPFCFNL